MKAVVKAKPGIGIEVLDVPKPEVKPDEVLLHVEGCSICGSDLKYYHWSRHAQQRGLTLPRILGHEGAGVVAEVGERVTRFKVGERVVTDSWGGCGLCYQCRMGNFNLCETGYRIGSFREGCMAEYVAVPEVNLYHLPDSISFDEAAILEPFGVGVHCVEVSRLKLGDDVVVMGPGPIGLLTAMAAKAAGAVKVIITGLDVDEGRLQAAANHGFIPINAERENATEKVKELTGGRGADVVFECAYGFVDQAIPLARRGGELVVSGVGEIIPSFEVAKLVYKGLNLTVQIARQPSTWYRAINLVASKTVNIKTVISHILPLAEAPEAFRLLLDKEATKVVLTP